MCPLRNSCSLTENSVFNILRDKWSVVPTCQTSRKSSVELLNLPDHELLSCWREAVQSTTTGPNFSHRGWYHLLYKDILKGKKVLEVGSGFGIDGITFALHGAEMTFADIVPSNLEVLKRLCEMLEIKNARFHFISDLASLDQLPSDYDCIAAIGSLHHVPREFVVHEIQNLVKHLKIGGRWIQLAYPKSCWIRDNCPPFYLWGEMLDGPGTPWAEWLDLDGLLELLHPHCFDVALCQEFHKNMYIWFDLLYRGYYGCIDGGNPVTCRCA